LFVSRSSQHLLGNSAAGCSLHKPYAIAAERPGSRSVPYGDLPAVPRLLQ